MYTAKNIKKDGKSHDEQVVQLVRHWIRVFLAGLSRFRFILPFVSLICCHKVCQLRSPPQGCRLILIYFECMHAMWFIPPSFSTFTRNISSHLYFYKHPLYPQPDFGLRLYFASYRLAQTFHDIGIISRSSFLL